MKSYSAVLPVENFLSGGSGLRGGRTPEYLSPAGPEGQENSQLLGAYSCFNYTTLIWGVCIYFPGRYYRCNYICD